MDDSTYPAFAASLTASLWDELGPLVPSIEDNEHIPHEKVWPALGRLGALGLLVPEQFGGADLSIQQYVPLIAEVAKIHGGIRAAIHVHNSFAHAVSDHATEAQRRELLPGAARGELSIAFALTEPDRGTGLDLGTAALTEGQDYVITGRKWLITNSDFASHFIVLARTATTRENALSAILVPRESAGLTISRLPETMGCKGGAHGLLEFDRVRVSRDQVLGGIEGRGEQQLEHALEISRLLVAASSLGTAEYALELSLQHAKGRVTFGRPIAERQAVQRYLAEMATDVYALRRMILDAAERWDAGERIPAEASMCKLFGLEAVGRVTDRALLVFGGIGYTRTHPIERLYRDARLNWLEEGTPTIQYLTIAREILATHEPERIIEEALA